jgi:transcriptional regulator of acetoin/glycerol metabolism
MSNQSHNFTAHLVIKKSTNTQFKNATIDTYLARSVRLNDIGHTCPFKELGIARTTRYRNMEKLGLMEE